MRRDANVPEGHRVSHLAGYRADLDLGAEVCDFLYYLGCRRFLRPPALGDVHDEVLDENSTLCPDVT